MYSEVSVLIPFKNVEAYFKECLDSVINSTLNEIEILLIHDHSEDNSLEIAREYETKDKRIKILHSKKSGIVEALNLGLDQAIGPLIARMDGDDVMVPERLEKQKKYLNNNPQIYLTSCLVKQISNGNVSEGHLRYIDWVNRSVTIEDIYWNLFIESPLPHPSVMFRKKVINQLGNYKSFEGPEDYDLWLRMSEAGYKMSKVNEVLLNWRHHQNNTSKNNPMYSSEAFIKRKYDHLLNWLQKGNQMDRDLEIWIWGAGKFGGRLCKFLLENHIEINGFLDIDPKKVASKRLDLPVFFPDEKVVKGEKGLFFLCHVAKWGARDLIESFMDEKSKEKGVDFLLL